MTSYSAKERTTRRGRHLSNLERRQMFLLAAINSNRLLPQHVKEARQMLKIVESGISSLLDPRNLDNDNISDTLSSLNQLKTDVGELRQKWNYCVEKAKLTPIERRFIERLCNATQATRAKDYFCRILFRLLEADLQQQFVFMHTLTIANAHIDHVMGPDQSKVFRNYQNRIKRRCPGAEFIAVKEYGEKRARPHFHYLWFCSTIPPNWCSDPNHGLTQAIRPSNIKGMQHLWPFGKADATAMRYGASDAWSTRLRWRWPILQERKENSNRYVPSRSYGLLKIAGYMSKYLSASMTSRQKGEDKWRNRMARNFGKQSLLRALSTLNTEKLIALAVHPDILRQNPLTIQGFPISPSLLQTATDTLLIQRLRIHYAATDLFNHFKGATPLPSIKERLRQTMSGQRTASYDAGRILEITRLSLSIGNSGTLRLITTGISKSRLSELLSEIQHSLDDLGFRERLQRTPR